MWDRLVQARDALVAKGTGRWYCGCYCSLGDALLAMGREQYLAIVDGAARGMGWTYCSQQMSCP